MLLLNISISYVVTNLLNMNFANKIVLITGAASGIGASTAINFSKLGASVALIDRNAAQLTAVANQIRESGAPEPLKIVGDVTEDTERIIDLTVEKFGKLDVLVNNAGIACLNEEELGSLSDFDKISNVNIRSILKISKLAIPHLEQTGGNIVNVSSIAATTIAKQYTAYSISKAAVDHFTRLAAVELAPKGIRVNAVKPGIIHTPIWYVKELDSKVVENSLAHSLKRQCVNRSGTPEDVANAIAFLAHDNASFINGHLLVVDGGRHLM